MGQLFNHWENEANSDWFGMKTQSVANPSWNAANTITIHLEKLHWRFANILSQTKDN